jgi:predicted transcriptional regulator
MKRIDAPGHASLSRREREIMEIVYRKPDASVKEIQAAMPQPPGYSAVRVIVNVLESKGHLRHVRKGRKYTYSPTTPRSKAVKGALASLLRTYFDDSIHLAVAAMVRLRAKDLSEEDWRQLAEAIERSRKGEAM